MMLLLSRHCSLIRQHKPCYLLQARDPIPQFRDFVLKQSILSEAQIKDIDNEVEAVVDDAVKFADESPKPVSTSPCSPLLLVFPYACVCVCVCIRTWDTPMLI